MQRLLCRVSILCLAAILCLSLVPARADEGDAGGGVKSGQKRGDANGCCNPQCSACER